MLISSIGLLSLQPEVNPLVGLCGQPLTGGKRPLVKRRKEEGEEGLGSFSLNIDRAFLLLLPLQGVSPPSRGERGEGKGPGRVFNLPCGKLNWLGPCLSP